MALWYKHNYLNFYSTKIFLILLCLKIKVLFNKNITLKLSQLNIMYWIAYVLDIHSISPLYINIYVYICIYMYFCVSNKRIDSFLFHRWENWDYLSMEKMKF